MVQDVKPAFTGSQQEIELVQHVFDLMMLQGCFFSDDAPIRQTLHQLGQYFVEKGLFEKADEAEKALDEALRKNGQVFYREEHDDDIVYVTTRKGSYTPPIRARAGYLPIATERHMGRRQPPGVPWTNAPKPQFIKREDVLGGELKQLLKTPAAVPVVQPVSPPAAQPSPAVPPSQPTSVPKRVLQVETPQGVTINLAKSPAEIVAKYREVFTSLVYNKLITDDRFVSFGNQWMLAEHLVPISKAELRQVREFIETSGGPETDDSLCVNVFNRPPEHDPAFCFSLNYHLAAEKRVFEFVGTQNQNLWWLVGQAAPRIVRSPLKPAEIGQDLKYLEDEPPVSRLPKDRWVHTLTFYEWENGILPYTPEAKVLLPPPFLKDQKIAHLRFEAPQFETSVYVELHYPTGNRGGWIEGLGEILAFFISGARLVITRVPDKPDTFAIQYEPKPVTESTVLLYDAKRQRFVFQTLPLSYQVDEAFLLERQRFGGMKDVRRLDEANRRRGDPVIIFAFEKIGEQVEYDGKKAYRARVADLLPIVNIEKPFSRSSLLRFFATHPHYQKDETNEEYYLYIPT